MRTVAQVGSVIGRSFAVQLLAQVIGQEQTALEMPLAHCRRRRLPSPGSWRSGVRLQARHHARGGI